MSRKHHYLKCETEYYQAIEQGIKTFELRKDDRGYAIGDILHLQETVNGTRTGRELDGLEVVYILLGGKFGLEDGYVIMQLK